MIPRNLRTLDGSIGFTGQTLTSIDLSMLTNITGTFALINMPALTSLTIPTSTSVGGIHFTDVSLLESMTGILSITDSVYGSLWIEGTHLSSLPLRLGPEIYTIYIGISILCILTEAENPFLQRVSLPNLTQIGAYVRIKSNSQQFEVDFPALVNAPMIEFSDLKSINLPALETVTVASFAFSQFQDLSLPKLTTASAILVENCSALQTLSFPRLSSIVSTPREFALSFTNYGFRQWGSLNIIDSISLRNISFPQLVLVTRDIIIANNSALLEIDGFPRVSDIWGNIEWSGPFHRASLPSIKHVGGNVSVRSTSRDFRCSLSPGVMNGTSFICNGTFLFGQITHN